MKANLKLIIFSVITILTGIIFWFSLYRLLFLRDDIIRISGAIFPIVSFVIFGTAISILFLITDSFRPIFWSFVVISGMAFMFFGIDIIVAIGLLAFSALCFLSWCIFQIEKRSRVEIRLVKIMPRALPALFTAFALVISLILLISPGLERGLADIRIPRKLFDLALKQLEGLASSRFPVYEKGMNADKLFMTMEVVGILTSGDTENLSHEFLKEAKSLKVFGKEGVGVREILGDKEMRIAIKNEVNRKMEDPDKVANLRAEYSEQFGIEIKENDKALDVLYRLINFQLNAFKRTYENVIPAALALGLFFILKAISLPFMWLLIFIIFIVLKLLKKFEIVSIDKIRVEKEVISLG